MAGNTWQTHENSQSPPCHLQLKPMKQAISDIILCAAALAAAICGLWLEGRGSAAGWPLAVAAALLAVLSPAVTGAGRTRLASVMEAVLVLFVSGGFLAYAERLGERIGLNAYSALSAAAALFALHELSAWWHCDGRLMLARNDGRRPPTLLLQLALTALLLGAAAAYAATTRTAAMAMAYAATMAAMAVGMTALAAMPRRLGPEMRRELRVGLADVALALAAGYGAAWLGGEAWLALTPAPLHALFLAALLADALRWAAEKGSRLPAPQLRWHRACREKAA